MEHAASHSICSIGFVDALGGPPPRTRRPVILAAAWTASPLPSAATTPASTARALIAAVAAFWGRFVPPSHLLTVATETPKRPANCSWVMLRLDRISRRTVEILADIVIFDIFARA